MISGRTTDIYIHIIPHADHRLVQISKRCGINGGYEEERSSHGAWTKLEGDDDEAPPPDQAKTTVTWGGGSAGRGRGGGVGGGLRTVLVLPCRSAEALNVKV